MAGDRAPPDRRHKRQYHAPVLARALPAGRRSVCAGPRSAAQSRAGDRPDRIGRVVLREDRKSTRLNSSHEWISYAVFCLKKKKEIIQTIIKRIIYNIQTSKM